MPKAVLTGPHDPFNAGSVRLAEATRIRLILPGLGNVEEEVDVKARSSKVPNEAAAKNRKKLSKLRGIAQQAEHSQSMVVVDEQLLADEEEADPEQQQRQKQQLHQQTQHAHQQQERARSGLDSSTSQPTTPKDVTAQGRSRTARLSPSGGSSEWSSRLASPGDAGAARAAAVKRIPIWERLSAAHSAGVKERPAAPQQKAMAPIALKTFSPTLGSLAALMPDSPTCRSPADSKAIAAEAAMLAGAKLSVSRRPTSPSSKSAKAAASIQQVLNNGAVHLHSMQHSPGSAAALLEKLTFGGR